MAATSHNSNAYTDQEKKFLMGPLLVGTIAVIVFLYVYFTIPSRPYEMHEAPHAAAHQEGGAHAKDTKTQDHPQAPQGSAHPETPKH